MKYALINNGLVENVIELDDPNQWTPPGGQLLVASDVASIGDTYADGGFVKPVISDRDKALIELGNLDLMLTPRRLSEAVVGDASSLAVVNGIIARKAALRAQL